MSVLIGLVILLLPFTGVIAQDEVEPDISEGCAAVDTVVGIANPQYSFVVYSFLEGDSIVVALAGTGTEFALLESGSIVVGPVVAGTSLEYIIPADGDYLFSVEVTGSAIDSEVSFSCTPAEPDDGGIVIPEDGNVTLCHYPPGNPAAAHTITVGAPAARTHIFVHGDTLGACPPGVNTRHDDPDYGTTINVIPITGEISIWGNCVGDTCSPIINIQVIQITIVNNVIVIGSSTDTDDEDEQGEVENDQDGDEQGEVDDDGHFVIVEPGTVFQVIDGTPNDNMYVIIYYLHPDSSDDSVGVFQINLYLNDTLINDSVLLFIDVNGDIVQWTTHAFWTEGDDQGEDEDA